MDIDIGNLVYLVFVAIIILVNLFTKKKKPTPRQRPQNQSPEAGAPPQVDPRKSFEELLEEFTKPQQAAPPPPPPPKPKPVPQPTTRVEPVRQPKPQPKPRPLPKKEHSVMKTEYKRFEEFKKSKKKQSPYAKAFRNPTSAREAFVFSEIFKKKF